MDHAQGGPSGARIVGVATLGVAAASLLVGCSGIEEPWVASPEQLEQERQRPPEMAKELRERARRVQDAR